MTFSISARVRGSFTKFGIPVHIRLPQTHELDTINAIILAAKSHWGYPKAWIAQWMPELEVTAQRLEQQRLWVASRQNELVGVVALTEVDELGQIELCDCWVEPNHMRQGIGAALLRFACEQATKMTATRLVLAADPNAEDFYLRMGAVKVGERASLPQGRKLPLMAIELEA